jgi:hypothetical protein
MYTITNIDDIVRQYNTEAEFIKICQGIFHENEDDNDSPLEGKVPTTVKACINYIKTYCDDLLLEVG